MATRNHRYGRGQFDAHPNYIAYMRRIVEHPAYAGMPNAVSDDGRINWQVSSGRTTSFYAFYGARSEWWEAKADSLGLPGKGHEQDRFTIAARQIHPTGYRACRLCGEDKHVGYFYLNALLARRLNKVVGAELFERGLSIAEVIDDLIADGVWEAGDKILRELFPQRAAAFEEDGVSAAAFERTHWMRSQWLSPGYMGDPPDRLDGFHDYCLHCREKNDPGRSRENLRSYIHDRRAFTWWAEGDWALADALFNKAGQGVCSVCDQTVQRVSPDHVGPLACGFKQVPYFVPVCQACNSSKNRRMSVDDVRRLIAYEEHVGSSAASWQVRGLWDEWKHSIETSAQAEALSAELRALQDVYLRVLHALLLGGQAGFLRSLLSPDYAFFDHEFVGLDPAALTFDELQTSRVDTRLRRSLARRSVRIAFEELPRYAQKDIGSRKLRKTFAGWAERIAADALALAGELASCGPDAEWAETMSGAYTADEVEHRLERLLDPDDQACAERNATLRDFLEDAFSSLGRDANITLD